MCINYPHDEIIHPLQECMCKLGCVFPIQVPNELVVKLKDAIISNLTLIDQAPPSGDQSVYTGTTGKDHPSTITCTLDWCWYGI